MAPLRVLITGPPGTGKTTLCHKVYQRLASRSDQRLLDGFLMQERRERGKRVGFDCMWLKDETQRAPLASAEGPATGHMVGKYHVQVEDFERFTVPILDRVLSESANQETIFVFDEIGKMELLSRDFISRVQRLLESKNPKLHVLGTVAIAGGGFIAQSKRLRGVELVEITQADRDAKTDAVAARFLATEDTGPAAPTGGTPPSPPRSPKGRGRWRPKAKVSPEQADTAQTFNPPARNNFGTGETGNASIVAMGKAAYGQLGGGDDLPPSCGTPGTPGMGVAPLSSPVAVSCGFDHTGIVTEDGLYLFGRNNRGQCGRPASGARGEKEPPDFSEDVAAPQLCAVPSSVRVKAVACGGDHTLVLMENGHVFGCGDNSCGQLGRGAGSPKMSPQLARCVNLGPADAVTAGFKHSAALCGDGGLYFWGANNQGQLGLGRRQNAVHEPQILDVGEKFRACALGRWHSLALTVTSVVWAFGWGRFGVLGQGDFTDHHHPVRVEGLPLPVHHLASGAVHCGAICGPSRQCFMWGRGSLGRCGMGESNVLKPRAIPNLEGLAALALGGDFSAAVSTAGDWWLWGKNEEGQLGFGEDRENRLAPCRSHALAGFRHIALGDCHAVAFR